MWRARGFVALALLRTNPVHHGSQQNSLVPSQALRPQAIRAQATLGAQKAQRSGQANLHAQDDQQKDHEPQDRADQAPHHSAARGARAAPKARGPAGRHEPSVWWT